MADALPLGWNLPAPATKEELLATLDQIRKDIEADDSFEGSFQYTMITDEYWLYPVGTKFDDYGFPRHDVKPIAPYGLMARWRFGNSMGQGGMTAYTKDWPEGIEPIEQSRERSPSELRAMLKKVKEEYDRKPGASELGAAADALEWALGKREDI